MKYLILIGTPREAVTLAPVIRAMRGNPELFEVTVCLTSAWTHDLVATLATFGVSPDCDLGTSAPGPTQAERTTRILGALDPVVAALRPDWMLVQGDGTTALVGALVAYYRRVRLAHLEAGLRTHDKYNPFPAEMNRRITDLMADLYFAVAERDGRTLLKEGIDASRVLVSGNPSIDALHYALGLEHDLHAGPTLDIAFEKRVILVAARHAPREASGFIELQRAIRQLATGYPADVHLVFPFPTDDPDLLEAVFEELEDIENCTLLPKLDYVTFAHLLRASHVVLTDSDAVQEEASSLGKPVLLMRNETERLDALVEGNVRLVGTNEIDIIKGVQLVLDDPTAYAAMARPSELYGDGRASDRIAYEFERRWENREDV